tara:strand:+ start:2442 stop:3071 length:630 start_codon:yes stop_codon:yes gene_type:complete
MVSVFLSNGWSLLLGAAGLAAGLSPLFFVFPPSLLFASFSQLPTGSNGEFSDRFGFEQASSECAAFATARLAESQALLLHETRGAVSDSGLLMTALLLMMQPTTVGKAAAGVAMAAAALPTRTPLPPPPPPPPSPPSPPPAPSDPPQSSPHGKSSSGNAQQNDAEKEIFEDGNSLLALPGSGDRGERTGGGSGGAGGGGHLVESESLFL